MSPAHLAWPLVALLGAGTPKPGDVEVATTEGNPVRLSDAFRSRPSVLFYEDKESNALNETLKNTLFARGKAKNLLDAASVVAIANVVAYDWFPARNLVIASVRDTEKQYGIPIYLDWKGVMVQPPWRLKPDSSTVVVVDGSGAVRYSKRGKLSQVEIDEVLALLATLIEAR